MNNIICYNAFSVTENGIILEHKKTNICIHFNDCANNYASENGVESSKCVATRDITTLSFDFYTEPKTRVVFKKCFPKDLISGKSAVSKFLDLQKAIVQAGYTTFDLS